jgi:hypothetical protein
MAFNWFRPRPGRYGIEVITCEYGNPGPILPVAVASSTVIYRNATPRRRLYVESLSVQIGTLATGSSTITIRPFKRNSIGAVSVALAAAFDLKTGTVDNAQAVAVTATDSQRTFQDGDYIAWDIVAAGTITQQPVDLFMVSEFAVLE